jgi:hypothetical protein
MHPSFLPIEAHKVASIEGFPENRIVAGKTQACIETLSFLYQGHAELTPTDPSAVRTPLMNFP